MYFNTLKINFNLTKIEYLVSCRKYLSEIIDNDLITSIKIESLAQN